MKLRFYLVTALILILSTSTAFADNYSPDLDRFQSMLNCNNKKTHNHTLTIDNEKILLDHKYLEKSITDIKKEISQTPVISEYRKVLKCHKNDRHGVNLNDKSNIIMSHDEVKERLLKINKSIAYKHIYKKYKCEKAGYNAFLTNGKIYKWNENLDYSYISSLYNNINSFKKDTDQYFKSGWNKASSDLNKEYNRIYKLGLDGKKWDMCKYLNDNQYNIYSFKDFAFTMKKYYKKGKHDRLIHKFTFGLF